MDALSLPIRATGVFLPAAPANSRDTHLLKPPPPPPNPSLLHHDLILNKFTTKPCTYPPKPLLLRSRSPSRSEPPPTTDILSGRVYRRASTGYAAALLDAARCKGTVAAVDRDVRRLARKLRGSKSLDSAAAESGGLVTALVRMLVAKGKVGLVGEVLEEFGRLYDEMTGTARVVVVSPEGSRASAEEIAAVARKVQRSSGAASVRVTHLVQAKPQQMLGALAV